MHTCPGARNVYKGLLFRSLQDKCGKLLNSCRVSELYHKPGFGKQTNKQESPIKIIALQNTENLWVKSEYF